MTISSQAIPARHGSGGKGGGYLRPPQIVETPDSVRSRSTARVLCLLSAGPVGGLADGARSVFLDDVPLENADGSRNFEGVGLAVTAGTPGQAPPPPDPAAEEPIAEEPVEPPIGDDEELVIE